MSIDEPDAASETSADTYGRPSRTARRYQQISEAGGIPAVATYLRERVYAIFTGLAIVLVVWMSLSRRPRSSTSPLWAWSDGSLFAGLGRRAGSD